MCTNFAVLQMFGDNFVRNCTRHFRTLFVHFPNCEMSILSNDAVHLEKWKMKIILTIILMKKKITRYNQMIVAIVDVLTSFDVVTNDNR